LCYARHVEIEANVSKAGSSVAFELSARASDSIHEIGDLQLSKILVVEDILPNRLAWAKRSFEVEESGIGWWRGKELVEVICSYETDYTTESSDEG
jgi:hypothetical protein